MNAFCIIFLQDCPLTLLERKYLNDSSCDMKLRFMKSIGIHYNCNHDYEYQLEVVTNIASATILKICTIFLLKVMKIDVKSIVI